MTLLMMTADYTPDRTRHATPIALLILAMLLVGCSSTATTTDVDRTPSRATPDYSRPLAPGESALRLIRDPSRWPDIRTPFRQRSGLLNDALRHSLTWFAAPSSRRSFPFDGISHDRAHASVLAMQHVLQDASSERAFVDAMHQYFDAYESVGYNGRGVVLFTGYYAPVFEASRVRTSRFTAPLYTRPDDLVSDEATGKPLGRRTSSGGVVPYDTRAELERSGRLRGSELVWVENDLDAFIIHVNGSAKLRLRDGSTMYVGYAGKTDRPYSSLGKSLVAAGEIPQEEITLSAIRKLYQRKPDVVRRHMQTNESYVFFQPYDGDRWPAGSLGVPVTAEASVATDKSIYPRGGLVLVDTTAVTFSKGTRRFQQFMMDQDTGGAIKAPGRADLFMGVGASAEILAGGQYAEGRLYYFFVKEEFVSQFLSGGVN